MSDTETERGTRHGADEIATVEHSADKVFTEIQFPFIWERYSGEVERCFGIGRGRGSWRKGFPWWKP